jgi:hypothetical protein
MAVVAIKNPSSFSIRYEEYDDKKEKNVTRSKTYGSVKADVEHQDIFDVAEAIVSLTDISPMEYVRTDKTSLNE